MINPALPNLTILTGFLYRGCDGLWWVTVLVDSCLIGSANISSQPMTKTIQCFHERGVLIGRGE
jgi:hypothetical protein